MERNEFIKINQKGIYTPELFRLYFVSVLATGLITLGFLGFIGYMNDKEFLDIILLKEQSWWLFYVIIFPLFYTLQQRKFELTIEPMNMVNIDKLVEYLKQKKFEVEYRDNFIVKMRNTPKFGWLFGKDMDTAEISFEGDILKLVVAGSRVYDISHTFRWTKDFLKD